MRKRKEEVKATKHTLGEEGETKEGKQDAPAVECPSGYQHMVSSSRPRSMAIERRTREHLAAHDGDNYILLRFLVLSLPHGVMRGATVGTRRLLVSDTRH